MGLKKVVTMFKRIGFLFFSFILIGCSSHVDSSYEKVSEALKTISNEDTDNPLMNYISISDVREYERSKVNEFEYSLSFAFTIENISDKDLELSFIAYVPEQLKSYFSVRETFEGPDVTLKPDQEMNNSFSGVIVQNPYRLEAVAREYLDKHGERFYVHFIIDEEDYYYELSIQ